MDDNQISNVVFDVGNVLVRWSPVEIVKLTFGNVESPEQLANSIFQNDIWLDLNKGLLTETAAKLKYQNEHDFSEMDCERLFYYVKHSQLLLFGSVDLLKRVKVAGYGVYALTDNVAEIVTFLRETYQFWELFDGAIVSSNVGMLKPDPEIFNSLLTQYKLIASETLFLDDMPYNVQGAKSAGLSAVQFENSAQCEQDLKALGLEF